MPLGVPIPPSPDASEILLRAFAERGIHWTRAHRSARGNRPPSRADWRGRGVSYDLFLGCRCTARHRWCSSPDSGRRPDPVDPQTLETSSPGVYAVGDAASVDAEGRRVRRGKATVVARSIAAQRGRRHLRRRTTATASAISSSGTGGGQGGRDVPERARPDGSVNGPSSELAAQGGLRVVPGAALFGGD